MKKNIIVILLLIMTLLSVGCSKVSSTNKETKRPDKIIIQAPAAPPTAPLIKLVEDKALQESVEGGNVELILYKNVEEAAARIARGEADFSVLPVNLASKLYNKEADISLLNVNTWGILYLLSRDGEVKTWEDLKGKEIYVGAMGSSPDVITRYLLNKSGINEDEVTISYGTSPEILQMMIAGKIDTVVLPEPLVTKGLVKANDMKISLNFSEEWEKINGEGSKMSQACIVVRTTFANEYKDSVEDFQNAYKEALVTVKKDPSEVSSLIEEKLDIPSAIFEKSMERTNLDFVRAADAKSDVETYLKALNDISGDMIGGKLPDEGFYYKK